MLTFLREQPWARVGRWARGIGLALLLAAFFLPLAGAFLLVISLSGAGLFAFGAFAWLFRDSEPWLRHR